MGKDGALGMLEIKEAGGTTIVQDEPSCAVFGMPRAAIGLDAADQVLPLDRIPEAIARLFTRGGYLLKLARRAVTGPKQERRMDLSKRVLIIDDSELVLAMAKDALEQAGFQVLTATNGIEGNRFIFSREKPDLIIMDIMMPMLDGNKKAKLLKENEVSRDIPILLLSSKSASEMQALVAEAGADGFILKPFTPEKIAEGVRKCLSTH